MSDEQIARAIDASDCAEACIRRLGIRFSSIRKRVLRSSDLRDRWVLLAARGRAKAAATRSGPRGPAQVPAAVLELVQRKQRFGRLTLLALAGFRWGQRLVRCRCDCGTIWVGPLQRLQTDVTRSCGCLRRDQLRIRTLRRRAGL